MGKKVSKPLSPELKERLELIFKRIDVNNSGTIDKEETIKYWSIILPLI